MFQTTEKERRITELYQTEESARPMQAAEPEREAVRKLPVVVPWVPFWVRLLRYGTAQITTPGRLVRWLNYWWRFPFRVASFLWAVTGPDVTDDERLERNVECDVCPSRYVALTRDGEPHDHCGKCGCPTWFLSRLAFKNRLRRWRCPLHKHAGTYPTDAQRHWLKEHGYDADKVLGTSACVGCGCGKAAASGTTAGMGG